MASAVAAGPGFTGDFERPNEWSADVEVDLDYAPSGDTVASLKLLALNIEGAAMITQVIGVELTTGDLEKFRGTIDAILSAVKEDTNA